MRTIAVTGGKGGTGKSSVAILMALSRLDAGERVLLADCDVECPNDYILLGIDELKTPIKKTYASYPVFDEDVCTKCGLCVRKCKSSALFQPPGSVPQLQEDLCSSCGVCWTICPFNAITPKKKQNGAIYVNEISDAFTLITGRSIPGVRETSPIVEELRDYIAADLNDFDTVILDTAAGTHCTVMSALDGADEAFAVTEPTPLGAHDLAVILKVLSVLEIPSNVVLNRCDVGDAELIEEIAAKFASKIALNIPYTSEFAKIYAKGQLWENKDELLELYASCA